MLHARTNLPFSLWPWAFGLLAFLVVTGLLAQDGRSPGAGSARTALPRGPAGPRRTDDEKLSERMREGTRLIDVVGSFQTAGDRISFHPDGKGESYRVLENLALQRVDEYLGANRGTPTWTVSGVMTEFRGSNYLLLQKAVVRSVGEGPAP